MKNIAEEQIKQQLLSENPWWNSPHKIPQLYAKWTPRPYLELFYPLITERSVRRAVALMGPRRVGKTVLIHHAIRNLLRDGVSPRAISYFSIDHPLYNGLHLEQFLKLWQDITTIDPKKSEFFVFFDEIQYLREWESHLKSLVDNYPMMRCIASGSAAAALRLKSLESGAGRFTDFLLPPLTFYEYLALLNEMHLISTAPGPGKPAFTTPDIKKLNKHFLHYLNFGGYPEVIFSKEIQRDPVRYIKSDIIDKVLLRDLPSLYGIHDIQELNYLFTTLAFNTANEISLEGLSQGSGVTKNTIKKYIDYLEAAFLIKIIHRIDRNARRFKRAHHFKAYLTTPSIRSALFTPLRPDDPAMGSLVETAIFAQWFHTDIKLYYARWKTGEIDMVALSPAQTALWAVEAKWSDRYMQRPRELKPLIEFCHVQNLPRGLITTKTTSGKIKKENVVIECLPASIHCFTLGYNVITGKQKIQ
jgi:predicted AAA+ superfamily ATPase